MAINIKSTKGLASNGVKILVYGISGAGKTKLNSTLPNPIILSAESGLLSLAEYDLPYIEIASMADLQEAYKWASESSEAKEFESIALDSISEIGEVVLNFEKKPKEDGKVRDPRQAYGAMAEQMGDIIRGFRDITEKHVYFSAKAEKQTDEQGRILYYPSMPGNKVAQSIPYFFDEVLALRVEKDNEGNTQRALMTDSDGLWLAKDRSGKLDPWEAPDLGAIINKIAGSKNQNNGE